MSAARVALGHGTPGQGEGRGTLETSGTTKKNGMPAAYRWIFSEEGFFRRDMRGTFPESVGSAGQAVWRVEGRGPAYPFAFLEEERWRTIAWVWSGAWALGDPPFEIALEAEAPEGEIALRLKLKRGLLTSTLFVDAETHLPERLVIDEEFEGGSLTFEDWRREDTRAGAIPACPYLVTQTDSNGLVTTFEAQAAGPWTGVTPAWVPARNPRRDSEFLPDVPSKLEVKRTASGHLFVKPRIDGQEVGWFLFDSGLGTSIVTKKVADELKLGSFGETYLMGFGTDAPKQVSFRQSHVVQLGPLLLDGLVLTETESMGMADRMLGGEACAGALGWDAFLRAVVELDPESGHVDLFDPDTYRAPKARWEEVKLHWQVPYLQAKFEGDRVGHFAFDTGAGQLTALFHFSAASRLGLLEERELEPLAGQGASGSFQMARATLEWFELAGKRHAPAQVLMSTGEDGESDPYGLGFVGSGFLDGQSLIFDYSRQRLGFVPRQ